MVNSRIVGAFIAIAEIQSSFSTTLTFPNQGGPGQSTVIFSNPNAPNLNTPNLPYQPFPNQNVYPHIQYVSGPPPNIGPNQVMPSGQYLFPGPGQPNWINPNNLPPIPPLPSTPGIPPPLPPPGSPGMTGPIFGSFPDFPPFPPTSNGNDPPRNIPPIPPNTPPEAANNNPPFSPPPPPPLSNDGDVAVFPPFNFPPNPPANNDNSPPPGPPEEPPANPANNDNGPPPANPNDNGPPPNPKGKGPAPETPVVPPADPNKPDIAPIISNAAKEGRQSYLDRHIEKEHNMRLSTSTHAEILIAILMTFCFGCTMMKWCKCGRKRDRYNTEEYISGTNSSDNNNVIAHGDVDWSDNTDDEETDMYQGGKSRKLMEQVPDDSYVEDADDRLAIDPLDIKIVVERQKVDYGVRSDHGADDEEEEDHDNNGNNKRRHDEHEETDEETRAIMEEFADSDDDDYVD